MQNFDFCYLTEEEYSYRNSLCYEYCDSASRSRGVYEAIDRINKLGKIFITRVLYNENVKMLTIVYRSKIPSCKILKGFLPIKKEIGFDDLDNKNMYNVYIIDSMQCHNNIDENGVVCFNSCIQSLYCNLERLSKTKEEIMNFLYDIVKTER